MTLEDYSAARDADAAGFPRCAACRWRAHCRNNPSWPADAPAYVDYVVFSVFQWARVGSPRDVLSDAAKMDAMRDWRARMVALFGGLGDRFAFYPVDHSGPDGRATQRETA